MSSVDNRVVKMTFDNSQFEQRIRTTLNSLKEFESKLKLDGASAGIESVGKAADKLNLSTLSDKAKEAYEKMNGHFENASKGIEKIDDSAKDVDFSELGEAAKNAVNAVNDAADDADIASPLIKSSGSAVDGINAAAETVDLSPIADETDESSRAFEALETIAVGALFSIGNAVSEKILGIGKKIKDGLIGPIADGFKEYETQIGSIQTIIANTGMSFDSDADIQKVNDVLDELNTYADKTIYNFTEMTKAIGTFTSSGLGLEEAAQAVQGAANVAALAGSGGSELTRVLPQLAQALSAGSVSQQDWMSIQTAHMDSRLFVQAIGDMAMHMAEAGKASESAFIAGERIMNGENMRSLLNKQDSKDISGWFSSDILAETLRTFTYDYDAMTADEIDMVKAHLAELGYTTDEDIESIFKRAKMGMRAAQEVRTWTQLWDTVGEAIGSNWSGIWRNFIGDFKQATDTFTFLSGVLSGGVDSLLGGIVHTMQIFNRFEDTEGLLGKKGGIYRIIDDLWGGYKRYTQADLDAGIISDESLIGSKVVDEITGEAIRVKGALDYLVEAVTKPLGAIKDAFDTVFGMDDFTIFMNLSSFTLAFKEFAASLVISDDAATGLRQIFEGLFSILDIGIRVVLDLGAAFLKAVEIARIFIDPLVDIGLALGGQVGRVILTVHDYLLQLREAFIEAIYPLLDSTGTIKAVVNALFGFVDIPGVINKVGDAILWVMNGLWSFLDLPGKIRDGLGWIVNIIIKAVGLLTGWTGAVNEVIRSTLKNGKEFKEEVGVVDVYIKRLLKNPIIKFISDVAAVVQRAWRSFMDLSLGIGKTEKATEESGLPTLFDQIKSSLKGIVAPIKLIGGAIGGILKAVFDLISAIAGFAFILVGTMFNTIVGGVKSAGDAVAGIAGMVSSGVFGAIPSVLGAIGGALQVVAGVLTEVVSHVSEFLTGMAPVLGAVLGNLLRILATIVAVLGVVFVKLLRAGIKLLREIIIFLVVVVSSIAKAIAESKPVQALLETFTKLGAVIEDFVSNFGNRARLFKEHVEKNFGGVDTWIGKITEKVSQIIEYFRTLNPEKVAAGITAMAQAIGQNVQKILYTLTHLNPQVMADAITAVVKGVPEAIKNALFGAIGVLAFFMPSVAKSMRTGIKSIYASIIPGISGIVEYVRNVAHSTRSLPQFFKKIFDDLWTMLKQRVSDIKNAITDFKPQDIIETFNNINTTIQNVVKEWVPDILPIVKSVGKIISDILKGLFDGKKSWGDMFMSVGDIVSGGIKKAGEIIIGILFWLKDKLSEAFGTLIDTLAGMENPIGAFFKTIRDKMRGTSEEAKKSSKEITDKIGGIPDSVSAKSENMVDNLVNFWSNFKVESIPQYVSDFFTIALDFLKGKATDLFEEIKEWPDKFGDAIDKFLSMFDITKLTPLIDFAKNIVEVKLIWESAGLIKGLGVLSKAVARHLGGEKTTRLGRAMDTLKQLALVLAVMAGALWVVSKIEDPQKSLITLVQLAAIVLALQGISSLIEKHFGNDGKALLMAASSVGILAASLILMLHTIEAFTNFDWKKNWTGVLGILAALALFAKFTKLLGDGGKNAIQAAIAIGIIAFLLRSVILPVIRDISDIVSNKSIEEIGALVVGLAIIAAFIGGLGYVLKSVGKDGLKSAVAFVIFSAALSIIGDAIQSLAELNIVNLYAATVALGALVGIFMVCTEMLSAGDMLKTAAAMLVFSASMLLLSYSVGQLAENDWPAIAAAGVALAGLMGALWLLATFTKAGDLIKTSAALVIFSVSIGVMAVALTHMASSADPDALLKSAAALGILIGVLTAAVAVLSIPVIAEAAMVILPLLALAFTAVGVAALLIAKALQLAVGAILQLAVASPVLTMFVNTIASNALSFGIAALALGALGAALMIFGPGALVAGLGLLTLSMGIREFLTLIADLPTLLDNAGAALQQMITEAPQKLSALVTSIGDWVVNVFLPSLAGWFQETFGSLGEFAATLGAWFMENIWPILSQAAADLANWATTVLIPWIMEHKGEILGKLGELASGLMDWLANSLLPWLGQVAQDFGNWMQTDGIPMLMDAKDKIFAKLGELVNDFGNWVKTEGVQMVRNGIDKLMEKAGEIRNDLGKWASNIPGWIREGLSWVIDRLGDAGSYIVQGISDGVLNGYHWITDAINGLGDWAVQCIKDFFGIASPSKLMRDEVGRYIPMGLAEGILRYANVAGDAAEGVGQLTLDKMSDALDGSVAVRPSISPVLDMNSFEQDADEYRRIAGGMALESDISNRSRMLVSANVSEDLASRIDNEIDQNGQMFGKLSAIESRLEDSIRSTDSLYNLADAWQRQLNSDMVDIRQLVRDGSSIYMDSGALVGAIAPEIDNALGMRMTFARRGVR